MTFDSLHIAPVIGNRFLLSGKIQIKRIIKGKFIRGPLPWDWFAEAASLPGRALHIALGIWFQVGINKSNIIRLPQSTFKDFGLTRQTVYRGLCELEKAGLVSIKRKQGASCVVTVIEKQKNVEPQGLRP